MNENPAQSNEPETDPMEARNVALQILSTVLDKHIMLDTALETSNGFMDLPTPRDRAFTRMIVTTALRRLGQIDDLIRKASSNPGKEISPPLLKHILRIGVTQIIFMDVPDHAAVNTSVIMAEQNNLAKTKGFVNAVLRKIASHGKEWTTRQDIPRLNTPEWILRLIVNDYDLGTAVEIGQAHMSEAPLDLTLKNHEQTAHWKAHLDATELPTGTLRLKKGGRIEDLDGYTSGSWWVQDAAAAFPATLFGNVCDKTIADLCAAPGGKTAQLASRGANVIALDRSARRLVRFRENIERLGLEKNVRTEAADASVWSPSVNIDGVLLDAPCTASGTLRKHPDMGWLKGEKDLSTMVATQGKLLNNAANMLGSGGILVYCTCSIFKDEGERQVKKFLNTHAEFSRKPITPDEVGGLTEFIDERGDLRILPHHLQGLGGIDGFFISRLIKR